MSDTKRIYEEHRLKLVNISEEQYKLLDKYVFTVSSGALLVLINLFDKIVSKNKIMNQEYFLFSSIFFGLSIACVVTSYFSGICAARKQITLLDKKYKEEGIINDIESKWSKVTGFFNASSIVLMLAGLCLMFWFIYTNFPEGSSHDG